MIVTLRSCALALLVADALAWIAGCGGDQSGVAGDPGAAHPVPGCEGIDHTPCDVRAAACQTRLFALAACLRSDQQPGPLPPIVVITEADLAAMLAAREGSEFKCRYRGASPCLITSIPSTFARPPAPTPRYRG